MLSVYRKYHKNTVSELKDILRWNKQIMTGIKQFVLFKVIDGELHGRLSVCPLCQGDLKFLEGDYDKIHCGGKFDEGKLVSYFSTLPFFFLFYSRSTIYGHSRTIKLAN